MNTREESLRNTIDLRGKELEELDLKLQASYIELGFSDKNDFLKHRISQSEKNSLLNRGRELDSALSSIIARKKDRGITLENEQNKNLSDRELPELQEELNDSIKESRNLGEKIGAMKQQLQDNSDSKLKLKPLYSLRLS